MHVQVDVDLPSSGDPPAQLGLAVRVVAARREARVDLLDLVGHRRPVADRAARLARQLAAQRGARHQPLELAGERDRVPGLEQQAALAVAE